MNNSNYNRVAVLLIGELRTWKHSSKYIINTLNNVADKVDWYLVTWDIDESSGESIHIVDEDVLLPFQKNNIEPTSYKILPTIGKQRSTFYNNAWLSKVANILKREVECNEEFVYDNVIECRVDLYLKKNNKNLQPCQEFELIGPSAGNLNGIMASIDLYFRSGSYTNDILSNRYRSRPAKNHYTMVSQVYQKFNDHHWILNQYIKSKFLDVLTVKDLLMVPFRDNFPTDKNLDDISFRELDNLFQSFNKIWHERKFKLNNNNSRWNDF
jgi:hypothetical protein